MTDGEQSVNSNNSVQSVPPLFMKDRDVSHATVSPLEICREVAKIIGARSIEGVQKINKLWRIYVKDRASRVKLFMRETLHLAGK